MAKKGVDGLQPAEMDLGHLQVNDDVINKQCIALDSRV